MLIIASLAPGPYNIHSSKMKQNRSLFPFFETMKRNNNLRLVHNIVQRETPKRKKKKVKI